MHVVDQGPEHARRADRGRQSPQDIPNGWRGVALLPPDLVGHSGRESCVHAIVWGDLRGERSACFLGGGQGLMLFWNSYDGGQDAAMANGGS